MVKNIENLKDQIIKNIDKEEVVKLSRDLIRIPSENPPCNNKEIVKYITDHLASNGIKYEIINSVEDRQIIISRINGNPEGKTLVLNGHLDVVPAGNKEKWDFPPYAAEINDGYLYGRGASDMKGGVAGLLVAYKAACNLTDLPGNVILTLVPDEETGGHDGSGWFVENFDLDADGCLIAEPSRDNPTIGQKGSCWIKLITRGEPGHGSLSPLAGDNAIVKMNRAIDLIYKIWEKEWEMPAEITGLITESKNFIKEEKDIKGIEKVFDHVTVNVGIIKGGDKVNKIPDYCEAEIDLRIPFGVKTEEVIDFIERELSVNNIEADLELMRWTSESNYTLPDAEIVRSVLRCAEEIRGSKPIATLQWASSDARYFRAKGIPTIQYGPAELEGIHSYNEKVAISELKMFPLVYAAVIVDFLSC